jgi:hypothetical protein
MSKNMRFIIIAAIIALVITIAMMPKKPAEIPVTASPTNGIVTESAPPATEQPAPAAPATAPQPGAEVDGVPAGTEATEDANQAATTTPAPVEATTPAPAETMPTPATQQ